MGVIAMFVPVEIGVMGVRGHWAWGTCDRRAL